MSVIEKAAGPGSAAPARLGAALRRAGFTIEALRRSLHLEGDLHSFPQDLAVHERRLRGIGDAGSLVGLFALGFPVERRGVERALGAEVVEEQLASGVLEAEDGRLRARLRIVPHGDLLLASDPARSTVEGGAPPDHVTGINAPASLLASLTPRRRLGRTLDLGCGNGIQGLLAARHSESVVATDINPRALAFTSLNASLNGISNLETRQGSLFEPVAGELFDLVVSNPPYVISPENALVFRDSGLAPGALCARVVGELPAHLAPGGLAVVLVSWGERAGDEPGSPAAAWVPEGVDTWLLHYQSDDPLTHAAKWNRPLADPEAFGAALDRWVAYLEAEGIERVCYGAIAMRRRGDDRRGWLRTESLRLGSGSAGRQLLRVFAAEDLLRRPDAALVLPGLRLRLVPEHRLDQVLTCGEQGWEVRSSALSLSEGVRFQGEIDGTLAAVLAAFAAGLPVGDAIERTASELGVAELELEGFRETAVEMTRRLLQLGFLEVP